MTVTQKEIIKQLRACRIALGDILNHNMDQSPIAPKELRAAAAIWKEAYELEKRIKEEGAMPC